MFSQSECYRCSLVYAWGMHLAFTSSDCNYYASICNGSHCSWRYPGGYHECLEYECNLDIFTHLNATIQIEIASNYLRSFLNTTLKYDNDPVGFREIAKELAFGLNNSTFEQIDIDCPVIGHSPIIQTSQDSTCFF